MRTFAALVLIALWTPALASPLTVRVQTRDESGKAKVVSGARVVVARADAVVYAGQALSGAQDETDETGTVVVERPDGSAIVLAGIPAGRGIAVARVGPTEGQVTLTLPPVATLSGIVLDPRGKPVHGVTVLAALESHEDAEEFLAPGTVVVRELTDSAGRFFFFRLAAGSRYRLKTTSKGHPPAVLRDVLPTELPVELRLSLGATIRGQVIAVPGGTAVPGARVSVGDAYTSTGKDGRFELRGITPGAHRLRVAASGHLHVEDTDLVLADNDVRDGLILRVLGMGRLRGRVLGPSTRPAPGTEIFLRYPPDPDLAERLPPDRVVRCGVADEEGRFDLLNLLPSQGVDLIARHPDFAPTVHLGYSIVAGVTFDSVILLRAGGSIAGRVVSGDGDGLEGVRVVIVDDREDLTALLAGGGAPSPTAREVLTDPTGAFVVASLSGGRKAVVALKDGLLPTVARGVEVGDGARREGLLIHIGAGARVTGSIAGPDGEPVPGARITLVPPLGTPREAKSDADGAFALEGIPAGPYFLRVSAEGFATLEIPTVRAPAEDLELTLQRGEGLSGRVLLEGSEEGIAGATVRALLRGGRSPIDPDRITYQLAGRVRTEPSGVFRLPDLAPGPYRVEAWSADGLSGFVDGVVLTPGTPPAPLTLRLHPGWAISGRVVRARDGMAVEGATVAVRGATDEPGPHRTVTNGQGNFRIDGVPPGFHTLMVMARDFAPRLVRSVEVRPAADTQLPSISLSSGGTIRGIVTGEAGWPRAGTRIRLASAELGGERQALTDQTGSFLMEGVAPGSYVLSTEDPLAGAGGRRHERLIRVEEGEELFLSLGSGEGSSLTGVVISAGVPVAHAIITALLLDGNLLEERQVYTTRSDADGNYLFTDLQPGDLVLLVKPAGARFPPIRFPARVLQGPVTILDLFLPQSGIEGIVEDLDTGSPLAGVSILVSRDAGGAEGTFLDRLVRSMGEVRTDGEGAFRFPALPAGEYRVEAYREGYGQVELVGIQVFAGGATPVRLAMPPAGTLTGQVRSDDGRPVSDARVTFIDSRGRVATREPWIEVDSRGRFKASALLTGVYSVFAVAPGFARARETGVDVFPGSHREIDFRLVPEGRLEVTVYGLGGLTLAGARVSIRDFWGRPVAFPAPRVGLLTPYRDRSVSSENGLVHLDGLPAGIYEAKAILAGHVGEPVRIRVLDGELSRGAIVLRPIDKAR